jgi:hypothetical protein
MTFTMQAGHERFVPCKRRSLYARLVAATTPADKSGSERMSMRLTTHVIVAAAASLAACSQPQPAQPAEAAPAAVAEPSNVIVNAPASGDRVTSPLVVEGTATGDWYFEAQFPARLVGADGALLAEAPALAQSDWMTEAPVPFRAELTFNVTQETPATLVLQEDMPADNANPREVTIPVVLVPRT